MYAITREEALEAKALFESLEGIDILEPSAVAAASLLKAVEAGNVEKDDVILLNIAGGGFKRLKEDFTLFQVEPEVTVSSSEVSLDELKI
jgi:cysteate synthase